MNAWAIYYDGGNQEDVYDERPSEFVIRQIQRACPDEAVEVVRLVNGWKPETVERRPPLQP